MIDLRSDTVTLPTEEMWDAMRSVPLRDDTLEGDPTVHRLEQLAAEITGKDDALFMASGTMSNVVATLNHARGGGGDVLVDDLAHIAKSEGGGMARLAGLTCQCIPAVRGEMNVEQLRGAIRSGYSGHDLPTAMICIETSHNHSGGYVPSLDYMDQVSALAREAGVPVHVDGARIFNAAVALGVDVRRIATACESLTFCLSKGLSAPMGAVLAGSSGFISRARVFRRMVGGGLRQSGIMAAAGIVALQTMVTRLADDHRRAYSLWERLRTLDARLVDATPPETNILKVNTTGITGDDASLWVRRLGEKGILLRAIDRDSLRLVTHRHIDDQAIDGAYSGIESLVAC